MKDFFEEVLKDSKMEFNPTLNELNNAINKPTRALKGYEFDDMVVELKGSISIHDGDNSNESLLLPIKDCGAFLIATVDGKQKEVGLEMNSFGNTSKKIDLIIAVNAIGQSESYSKEYKESMLNFAINKVMIPVDDGFMNLKADSIVYLEATKHNTKIFFNNGVMITSHKALGYFKDSLPMDNYYEIHNSYLLNVEYIRFINTRTQKVDLQPLNTDDCHNEFRTSLPISAAWEKGFIDFLERRQRKG